jgi:hypothetical protein
MVSFFVVDGGAEFDVNTFAALAFADEVALSPS